VFAGFAALAQRLSPSTPEGTEFRFFLVPNAEIAGKLSAIKNEQMQTGPTLFDVRRYELTLGDAGASTVLSLTTATDGSLLRITLPAQSVDVLREDIAGANTRTTVYTNPGDQRASIPALGFNLAATITFPSGASTVVERKEVAKPTVVPVGPASRTGSGIRTASPEAPPPEPDPVKRPGVVLVAGKASPDRDTITAGVPAMSHLAGALAEAGFVVVRYDNRGVGQSGGRTEAATLTDYAGDLRGVVKWMADRKDVDDRRIAVVGYGDGGWMAMSAAASDKRIAAVVSLAAPASKGVDVVLDQQRAELQALAMSDSERKAKEALQKQIHAAVLSGKGWDQIPPELRRRADTPWFHSLLAYDPGKVIDDIRAPILIVHGDIDQEVPVDQAERLAALAKKGKSDSVELVIVRGVNHRLVPAVTGSTFEYPALIGRQISPEVSAAVTSWLTKTMPERR
jgi:pimeloyl-ACP methyl ester carboxylesterase